MAELLDEIHPGEILLEDFMKPMGISARQLAADIDVSPSRISDLVNDNRPVTADTALRLGLFFNMAPRFWMNLQTEYHMRVAARTLTEKIAPRIRVFRRPWHEVLACRRMHVRAMYDLRQELISNGVLVMQAGLYQFTQDYTFSSPSTAASVLLGRSANGRIEWKGEDCRTLKELQAAEAGQ